MKSFLFISLLCIASSNVMYAQRKKTDYNRLNRNVENAALKAVREAEAKQKAAEEEARKKEQEKAHRHEQQRRQHEATFGRQMNNLNSVSAGDYMTGPKQQTGTKGFQATTYKAKENPKAPVVNQKKKTNNRQANNSSNRNNYGTPSYSGNDYNGNLYDNKRTGFSNTQQRVQTRKPANEYGRQYPTRQPKGKFNGPPAVTSLQRQETSPKISVQTSTQQNTQYVGKVQAQQRTPVQEKKAWIENGKLVLDTSKKVYINSQTSSSADLEPVDMTSIDYATKIKNTTVYNIPQEAYFSSRDNKTTLSAKARKYMNAQGMSGLTTEELTRLARKDAASGFESIHDPVKFENIYGRVYAGTIRIPSHTAIQKR